MAINILGICGSPRRKSSYVALAAALETAKAADGNVETDLVELRKLNIHPCVHCNGCLRKSSDHCVVFHDDMDDLYEKLYRADGIIVASPVYTMNITAQLAAFFDRFRPTWTIINRDSGFFTRKVGGAIAVGGTRNGGEEATVSAINGFFFTQGINVVSVGAGTYTGAMLWNPGDGSETMDDPAGMDRARAIGKRVAVMARVLKEADLWNL